MDQQQQSVMTQNAFLGQNQGQTTSQGNEPFSTTTMQTCVGEVPVMNNSYDIQGNVVDSTMDTPIDVNALYDVQVTDSMLQIPETGLDPIIQ